MWEFLKKLGHCLDCVYQTGSVMVRESGEIFVPLPFTPDHVLTEASENHHPHICHAEPDGFDIKIVPDGFVIIATLHSKHRKLWWLAIR